MTVVALASVDIARSWLGTPYRHQGTAKHAGCDCLGLLRGVWREIYGQEPEAVPRYSADWSEPQREERLWEAATRHLIAKPVGEAAIGDVLLFRMRDSSVAKHLGLQSELASRASFIHAYDNHGVVESPLSTPWQRRIVARFRFPEEIH